MKNIKTIEEFLLEALRDTWRETVDLSTAQEKYFGVGYSDEIIEGVIYDVVEYLSLGKDKSWLENARFDFYDADGDGGGQYAFWERENIHQFFLEYIKKYVMGYIEGVLREIQNKEIIVIYRAITVNQVWLDLFLNKENDEVHLGKYWSWNQKGAIPYHGKDKSHLLKFKCNVLRENINLFNTFLQNVIEPFENEIQLFPNTPLELLSITIDGEEVDLSNFKNKEIYA